MKGQRKKAMWAKKRVENAAKREAEKKVNTARKPRKRKEFVELKPRDSKFVITAEMERIAALPSLGVKGTVIAKRKTVKPQMSEEDYAKREAAAKAEIERKKKQVAPLYNKGGYQYVGDDAPKEIIHNLGRKV